MLGGYGRARPRDLGRKPAPDGDHLARYLDACTAGKRTRAYFAAVLGERVVITYSTIVGQDQRHSSGRWPSSPWTGRSLRALRGSGCCATALLILFGVPVRAGGRG